MTPIQRRQAATQATRDRFFGKPFKFGRTDCGMIVKWHLRAIGCPFKAAAKVGSYHSLLGAKKALKKLGYADLIALMDDNFERIPPAAALMGDVIALTSEDDLGALTVYLGNGRVLGHHQESAGATVLQPLDYIAAWRLPVSAKSPSGTDGAHCPNMSA